MIKKIIFLAIAVTMLTWIPVALATTYYIDYSGGSDDNDGLTKSTPWKHAPGMRGATGGPAVYEKKHPDANSTSNAGDRFILKGGVIWPKEALCWDWIYGSGTEQNPIYFGVDKTWYAGATWSRPVLDAENTEPSPSPEGQRCIFRAYGRWLVVDNIEFKRAAQLHGGTNGYGATFLKIGVSGPSGGEVKNCYFHGWSHGGTATADNSIIVQSALIREGPDMNLRIHHNVWDGSDTTKDMACAYRGSCGHFYCNYIGHMQNGIVANQIKYVWGNTFEEIATTPDFDSTQHHQSIEQNGGQSIIYNNYIHNSKGGGTILIYGSDGHKDYIFNNVIVGDHNQILQLGTKNGGTVTLKTGQGYELHVFNNTLQAVNGNNFSIINGPPLTEAALMPLMAVRNNLLIGPNPTINFHDGVDQSGKIDENNIKWTNSEATNKGYVYSEAQPYYPPPGGDTINAGMNLNRIASAIPSSGPSDASSAALYDTTCGVAYDRTNHRVIAPKRTPVARGNSWDIGAYQFAGEQITPSAPSNLKVLP